MYFPKEEIWNVNSLFLLGLISSVGTNFVWVFFFVVVFLFLFLFLGGFFGYCLHLFIAPGYVLIYLILTMHFFDNQARHYGSPQVPSPSQIWFHYLFFILPSYILFPRVIFVFTSYILLPLVIFHFCELKFICKSYILFSRVIFHFRKLYLFSRVKFQLHNLYLISRVIFYNLRKWNLSCAKEI